MKKLSFYLMAALLMLGMAQCQKENNPKNNNNNTNINNEETGGVSITLRLLDGSKADLDPGISGAVNFTTGDQIVVAYNGKYVGLLDYVDGVFVNDNLDITPAGTAQPLYFYFLGNRQGSIMPNATACMVNLSDQSESYAVMSYGPSNENFDGSGNYTAFLLNQCGLVKFRLASYIPKETPVTVSGMTNMVMVNFGDHSFAPMSTGYITLKPETAAERWAILPIQDAKNNVSAAAGGYGTSGNFNVPAINANAYLNTADKCVNIPQIGNTVLNPPACTGEFSSGVGKTIRFATGNLRYNQGRWSFAERQFDVLGTWTYEGEIDLFTWGATGYNDVFPYNRSSFYFTGNGLQDILTVGQRNDWGYCANQVTLAGYNDWRTPSREEMYYILYQRDNASSLRGGAQVNGINGLIILPDNWSGLVTINTSTGPASNTLTTAQWSQIEALGAVFLPASGYITANSQQATISNLANNASYWLASNNNSGSVTVENPWYRSADYWRNNNGNLDTYTIGYRSQLNSVRLVR